jgi:hypothetical protein
MRRAILPVLAAAAAIPAASSLAQDAASPIIRKPGWWEMQVVVTGPTPEPIHQTQHVCTDAESDKRQSPFGVNMNGGGCPAPKITRTSDRWVVSGACDTGVMKITADAVATGDLNDRYHADITVHMDPPPQPQAAEVRIGLVARWVGQCPADKKPGDVEISPSAPPAN